MFCSAFCQQHQLGPAHETDLPTRPMQLSRPNPEPKGGEMEQVCARPDRASEPWPKSCSLGICLPLVHRADNLTARQNNGGRRGMLMVALNSVLESSKSRLGTSVCILGLPCTVVAAARVAMGKIWCQALLLSRPN